MPFRIQARRIPARPAVVLLVVLWGLLPLAFAQSGLRNGYIERDGLITWNDTDEWVFNANEGDYVSIRMAVDETNYDHRAAIILDYSGGRLFGDQDRNDFSFSFYAPATAQYHIEIGDVKGTPLLGRFEYIISLARSGADYQINQGDEGGALVNGARHTGQIGRGDIDMWSFEAIAGNPVDIGLGELAQTGSFGPTLRVFTPAGGLVGVDSGSAGAEVGFTPETSGTYLIIVENDPNDRDASGSYQLTYSTYGDFVVSPDDEGGPLTSGGVHFGEITPADLDMWSFEAVAGDYIKLGLGELTGVSGFEPGFRVLAPDGSLLTSDFSGFAGAEVDFTAATTGRYIVVVEDGSSSSSYTGTYQLFLARAPAAFVVPDSDEGGPLINGGVHLGTITPGDLDLWSFAAVAGDHIELGLGELSGVSGFKPGFQVRDTVGNLVAEDFGGFAGGEVSFTAPTTGGYLIIVEDGSTSRNYTGTYQLFLARAPADFIVPQGDEGGPLTNGGVHLGTITPGDLDLWSFAAVAGDHIELGLGELSGVSGFKPGFQVRDTVGNLVAQDFGGFAGAEVGFTAATTGRYVIIVEDGSTSRNYTGTYQLFLARAPADFIVPQGDEGGPLTNGGVHLGTITPGDLDLWSFEAVAGDHIELGLGELTGVSGFEPGFQVRDAVGNLVAQDFGGFAGAEVSFTAATTGRYVIIVEDGSTSRNYTGTYQLFLARAPADFIVPEGDEGGPLINGGVHLGTITPGDLDLWSFEAVAGDHIELGLGELTGLSGFEPGFQVRDAVGNLVAQDFGGFAGAEVGFTAATTGRYVIIVEDGSTSRNYTGTYQLFLARAPAAFVVPDSDEGGPLTDGGVHLGTITPADLDLWTFVAEVGDRISLVATELSGSETSFGPGLFVVAPNGSIAASNFNSSAVATLNFVATRSGLHMVVVEDNSSSRSKTGLYDLGYTHTIGDYAAFVAASGLTGPDAAFDADPNHDGIPNGIAYAFHLSATDLVPRNLDTLPEPVTTAQGPGLQFTLPERLPPGLVFTVETSSTLDPNEWQVIATLADGDLDWTVDGNAFAETPGVNGYATIIGRAPDSSPSPQFFRLRVRLLD